MKRKLSFAASRSPGHRLVRWVFVALAGTIVGLMLGEMVARPMLEKRAAAAASFSRLSANPDAQMTPSAGAAPCLDCPDSYGVAIRLRSDREQRMSDEFRELGAVDVDPPVPADIDDGYRYGGRFPDPAPRATPAPVPAANPVPGAEDSPATETSAPPTID